ncbi:18688_t:CDS:2, partial [Gigaspora rosea]
ENITSIKKHSDKQEDTRGVLRLTISGSRHFRELNGSGRRDFFFTLINNLTFMIPTEKGRLGSDRNYQLDKSNILISLSIREANDGEKLTAADIKDNLHQLITNKAFTGISTETVTDFLDEAYGFQQARKNYFQVSKRVIKIADVKL